MPTFRQAEKEDVALLNAVIKQYHPDLVKHDVTVGLLWATGGLKLHGYPAAALVRINALRLRVQGAPDCTIELDGETWPDRPESERRAILDHELFHCEIVFEENGVTPKTDDAGRPKIKLRRHNIIVGGFSEIIERHREAALEARHIAEAQKWVQQLFKY